jgi:hypothetical protein
MAIQRKAIPLQAAPPLPQDERGCNAPSSQQLNFTARCSMKHPKQRKTP